MYLGTRKTKNLVTSLTMVCLTASVNQWRSKKNLWLSKKNGRAAAALMICVIGLFSVGLVRKSGVEWEAQVVCAFCVWDIVYLHLLRQFDSEIQ